MLDCRYNTADGNISYCTAQTMRHSARTSLLGPCIALSRPDALRNRAPAFARDILSSSYSNQPRDANCLATFQVGLRLRVYL